MSLVRYEPSSRAGAGEQRGLILTGDGGAAEHDGGPGAARGIRPALELAWAVARQGAAATPAVLPPAPLRPLLNFAKHKLPERALAAARRALDTDAEFRARVVEAAEEAGLGRPAWLLLSRPEGWEAELDALLATQEKADAEAQERRADETAQRRLARAQQGRDRLERSVAEARARAAKAVDQVRLERQQRQEAEERARALQAELEDRRAELARLRAEMAAQGADLEASRAALAATQSELAANRPAPLPPELLGAVSDVAAAALAARKVADNLAAAAAALQTASRAAGRETSAAEPATAVRRSGRRPARVPTPVPPGVYDDSREAAAHLIRVAGVLVVVDGYNASHSYWPDLHINEQRRRLVDALSELAARTGAEVQVVFDGAEQVEAPLPGRPRQAVRVQFSPPGTEADDVIIDLARELPAHRPVVVVSSDRRVQDGAAAAGANVVTVDQLRGLLRLAG